MAMSILPSQAPSIRTNALRLPLASTTAISSSIFNSSALLFAPWFIFSATSRVISWFMSVSLAFLVSCGEFRSRIVLRADVFKAKRPNRRHLCDVLTGFRPVEMGRIARQNDDATGGICLQLIGVELIAEADIENARHNCVHSILRVPVWHQFHAVGYSDPDRVGAGLRGPTDNDCKSDRRWERSEGLPVDIFRQDRSENVLARVVRSNRTLLRFYDD